MGLRQTFILKAAVFGLVAWGLDTGFNKIVKVGHSYRDELYKEIRAETLGFDDLKNFPPESTAVFVFTGSPGRECHGVEVADGIGCDVFISGANPQSAALNEEFRQANDHVAIYFDTTAQNTTGNVRDVIEYVRDNPGKESIIIVSDLTHLPRVKATWDILRKEFPDMGEPMIYYFPSGSGAQREGQEFWATTWMKLFNGFPPRFEF